MSAVVRPGHSRDRVRRKAAARECPLRNSQNPGATVAFSAGANPPAYAIAQDILDGDRIMKDDLKTFYGMDKEIGALLESKQFELARTLAEQYLELAQRFQQDWNFGNAIHDANCALGLCALASSNVEEAKKHLLAAAQSPGSPQLNSFGPKLDLADRLLKLGLSAEVGEYLRLIERFWELNHGVIAEWCSLIDSGQRPELDRFGAIRFALEQKRRL